MDRRAVYLRTSKGLKELMGRTSLLGSTDRDILFLVTGKVSLGEIEARLDPSLKSRLQASIDRLVREEFIFMQGPSGMGTETDITNGTLIEGSRNAALSSAMGARGASDGADESDLATEEALESTSDDFINAALRQAQSQSRRQSIVDRLQHVEQLAVTGAPTGAAPKVASRPAGSGSAATSAATGVAPALNPALVLARTAKGAQEFIGRTQTLQPTLAKLLTLIDGEATVATIVARVGDPDGRVVGLGIQKLLRDGYVQEATVAIKDFAPGDEFEAALNRNVVHPLAGDVADPDAAELAQAPQVAAPVEEGAAFGEVARALADHAAIEARVEQTAREVIARAAAPSAPTAPKEEPPQAPINRSAAASAAIKVGSPVNETPAAKTHRRGDGRAAQAVEATPIAHSVDPARVASEPKRRRLAVPRWALVLVTLLACVGAGAYWLSPLFDTDRYAQAASRMVGRPVSIGGVGVEFAPAPAIRLTDVRVGGGSTFRADSVDIMLVPATLLDPGHALHAIRMRGAMATTDELHALLGTPAKDPGALGLRSVEAHDVKIVDRYWTLSGLSVRASVGPHGDLGQLVVATAQGDTRATFTPAGTGVANVEISAGRLRPFGADFELLEFGARGTYSAQELVLADFDGRILQGVVKGQARIRPGSVWHAEGTVEARGMELAALSKHLLRDGQFSAKARFNSSAPGPDKLFSVGMLEGAITADRGSILGVDISRVAQGEALPRGTTPFTELFASFRADAGLKQIAANVRFRSNRVAGVATLHVDAKQVLTGQMSGELATPAGPLRGTVNLSGTAAKLGLSR